MVLHFVLCVVLQFAVCSAIGFLVRLVWKPTVGKLLKNSRLLRTERAWEEKLFSETPAP